MAVAITTLVRVGLYCNREPVILVGKTTRPELVLLESVYSYTQEDFPTSLVLVSQSLCASASPQDHRTMKYFGRFINIFIVM